MAAVLLAGCAPTLVTQAPEVDDAEAAVCAELADALPEELADARRRDVDVTEAPDAPSGPRGTVAAWGDPPLVLTCGVGTPDGFSRLASACQDVAGVDWFVPDDQMQDQASDAVATTIGFEPGLELRIPADYRPPVEVLVEIAPAVRDTVPNPDPCVVADPRG